MSDEHRSADTGPNLDPIVDTPDAALLRVMLADCVALIEGWAYGPLFQAAGIEWPGGVCRAPALVAAKAALGQWEGEGS